MIEVRVKTASQLFDSRDPAPFRERDLDDDFVEYITAAANEFPHKTPLRICVYIEGRQEGDLGADAIKEAVQSHTEYAIEIYQRKLKDFIRRGQIVLIMGLTLLGICLGLSQAIPEDSTSKLLKVIGEGLIIIGWVSIWRPIELLLYDWWPIYDHLRLLRKLIKTELEIKFDHK